MKYRQLTKEQFEALHEEFAQFLASQQVDINEWNTIKKDKPEVAEQELNLFSDVVWDDVLNRTKFLEHFSEKSINLFKVEEKDISRIVVQINKTDFSFFNDKDYQWFIDNTKDGSITFYKGVKKYESDRNSEIFDLIQKGSVIADGKLYEGLFKLIS
ncbi:DUF6495 family protein [Aureibaculum luteum]|uniref:DUF6495 family protein n=1 Tax=Aureibaculum luteum TaxID=1548456 RepID=UPI000E4924E3|nr:DUF6495 family protein [Aureibaculum luteum]